MKLVIFTSVVCVAVMVVMVFQAAHQELIHKRLRNSAQDKAIQISSRENAVSEMKKTIQGIRPEMLSHITMTDEMRKNKDNLQKEKTTMEENINTCNKEKGEAEKSKNEVIENFNKLKLQHSEDKGNAQKTIEELKQQILNRDKAICAVVDTTNAEARKLCGLGE